MGVAHGGTTDRPPRPVFLSRASLSASPACAVINFFCFRTPSSVLCFRFLVDDKVRARASSTSPVNNRTRLKRQPTLSLTKLEIKKGSLSATTYPSIHNSIIALI
ncbi:hypothetical protein P5V15_009577 [Pogonomyrmex californicus]